jgi:hypothetical protein
LGKKKKADALVCPLGFKALFSVFPGVILPSAYVGGDFIQFHQFPPKYAESPFRIFKR